MNDDQTTDTGPEEPADDEMMPEGGEFRARVLIGCLLVAGVLASMAWYEYLRRVGGLPAQLTGRPPAAPESNGQGPAGAGYRGPVGPVVGDSPVPAPTHLAGLRPDLEEMLAEGEEDLAAWQAARLEKPEPRVAPGPETHPGQALYDQEEPPDS